MIILIGGEKGGTGKTTIATNLASWLSVGGRDVLLLDADRQGTARRWCDRRSDSESLAPVKCVERHGRLAGSVRDLATRFDDVVIDCGGHDSDELRSAMLVADVMFIPVQASMFDLETLGHVSELVYAAQTSNPSLRAMVFVSRAPTNQRSEEKAAIAALHGILPDYMSAVETVIHDRRAFRDAAKTGRGVLEWTDTKAKLEFKAFAAEVIKCATARTEAA